MTFEERMQKAREYYRKTVADAAQLMELRGSMDQIRAAVSNLSGIPTLSKLSAFVSAVKAILGI